MTDGTEENNVLCMTPTKRRYATAEAAREEAARVGLAIGQNLTPYEGCTCGWIHLTKERELGAIYTQAALLTVSQNEFTAVVRSEITGRSHPDTARALRAPKIIDRWEDALNVFWAELEAQLVGRSGDASPVAREWRKRIARVQVGVRERRAEIKHLRRGVSKQATAEGGRREAAPTIPLEDGALSPGELRAIAGDRAMLRLKKAHWVEYLTIVREEHASLSLEPSNNLLRSLKAAGLLDASANTEKEE